ncbi:B12-binding domain-containing radical SAM protein [Candidatus Omnitrophota bacterium]
MNKRIAIVLLPVFWPNLPPIGAASLKAFLGGRSIPADALDYNNYFFNRVSDDLKAKWRVSCNDAFEENIVDTLRAGYAREVSLMIGKLLQYDIAGFSCHRSNFPTVKEIAGILKKERPGIEIVFGGPEIARRYFKNGRGLPEELKGLADLFVVGEGELPLYRFVQGDRPDEGIAAFCELKDLKALPAPDYSDFDPGSYPKKSSMSLNFSRGCVRRCGFCSERLLYKGFRARQPASVVDEIKRHRKKGIGHFIFHDSLINGDLEGLEGLFDGMLGDAGPVSWEAQIAVRSDMPDELFKKMKRSGCVHLFVGLESGCDRTLARMDKGFNKADALEFFGRLKKHDLSFGVSIITGFPGESKEDFEEGLDFIVENKDVIRKIEQVNPFVYYDGTDLPETADYRYRAEPLGRARVFIDRIKAEGIRHTAAFTLNLVEKQCLYQNFT